MELGTWNLELGFCRLSGQVQDPRWPKTADSKFPGPTSRRAPKNKASSTRPFSEGKFHASRSFRGQVPSSGTVMAQRGVRFFLSATAQELAVKILNPHFPRLGPYGTSHYRVRFRSSGGASSSWMSGMSIIAVSGSQYTTDLLSKTYTRYILVTAYWTLDRTSVRTCVVVDRALYREASVIVRVS
jgi:hypothetical protein